MNGLTRTARSVLALLLLLSQGVSLPVLFSPTSVCVVVTGAESCKTEQREGDWMCLALFGSENCKKEDGSGGGGGGGGSASA